jgi:Fe-S cluster assembly ATP-binding protein
MGILIITHHEQLLEHNIPLRTHVMLGGRIVESGGPELAAELHKRGYERIRAAYPDAAAAERSMQDALGSDATHAAHPVTA